MAGVSKVTDVKKQTVSEQKKRLAWIRWLNEIDQEAEEPLFRAYFMPKIKDEKADKSREIS